MNIRVATENDLSDILRLYAQPDMDNGNILSMEKARDIFDSMATYPDYAVYVAETEDIIVGTFALLIMDNLAHKGSKSGVIEDVVVAQQYQNKGIGKQMMIYAMDVCKIKKCYKVSLSSNVKRKNAHRFYENLGFGIHGYSFLVELE